YRETHIHRARDGARIAVLALAPLIEHAVPLHEDVGGEERHVPAVGVPGNDAQHPSLALTADPEAESRLERAGETEGVDQLDVAPLEGHPLAVEQPPQHDGLLLEQVEPVTDGRKGDPEGPRLDLVPP